MNKNENNFLNTLCTNLEKIGFSEQEYCGILINLSLNNKVVNRRGYSYTAILSSKNKVFEMKDFKDEFLTTVSDETIQRALNKSKTIMKKSLISVKECDSFSKMQAVGENLEALVREKDDSKIN